LDEGLENLHTQLPKGVVTIVLADGEVDEVASDAVEEDVHEGVEELELVLVDVPTLCRLLSQLFCKLQVLDGDLGGLFEADQTVDVPAIKAESAASIVHQLTQEFEYLNSDLIIRKVTLEGFTNNMEVLRVEPVKEECECLLSVKATHNTL
jgi:hypothetical protein